LAEIVEDRVAEMILRDSLQEGDSITFDNNSGEIIVKPSA